MKNILIGVSGGIAAYKAANIVSGLRKRGYDVKVVMTENAAKIITPLAFESLSKHDVAVDMWERNFNVNVEHIALADWADIILVAPATYNIVGKVAGGIADDMLSTVISAFNKTVYFALAMNVRMYENPILAENIKKLKKYGYKFIEADEGLLACNVNAKGRLKNEQEIIEIISKELEETEKISTDKPLAGKKVMITAGRTEEPLDPIRYFSNKSTGKMGYSLGEEAEKLGADVTIVSGPTNIDKPDRVNIVEVRTAEEMYGEVMKYEAEQDIIIAAAAVADYKPEYTADKKIKKGDMLTVNFIRNKDILLELGKIKKDKILVGFAAESENLIENAKEKLQKKNLDMIVVNSVDNFGTDDNTITLLGKDFETDFEKMEKKKVSKEIWKTIKEKFL
ncbi:bifunctional phosphopantothenoylcysteine decarboxylase/phosphopantothenate--cysteine ligase CoaBC [Sebaldella termitidis]|uniref:bifunctional phosphopantothenoylcysteine decarboxylase/phosphopantothenate--cysteine ligase CoaBC n=1 Tax=Sebaldella termitidis TaxID=826 RepID=UPI003EB9E33E